MKLKNTKSLILELCRREAKKKQVNVAQMSEIVARLRDIFKEDPCRVISILWKGKT